MPGAAALTSCSLRDVVSLTVQQRAAELRALATPPELSSVQSSGA